MPWRAFDIRWFERWQDVLYFLLNAPVVKWWSRWILRINGERSSVGRKRIQAVLPHAIYWLEDDGQIAAEFRTHPKFAKRVYYAFKPIWDLVFAFRVVPCEQDGYIFGAAGFTRRQPLLLYLLNGPLRGWFRWVLRISGKRSSVGDREIVKILPHAIWWRDGEGYVAEFRTHNKFSKRIYHAFRPLWETMHFWDWLVADRFAPSLSFGFNNYTVYPDPDTETTTVDGIVEHWTAATGVAWTTLTGYAGNGAYDNDTTRNVHAYWAGTDTDAFQGLLRSIYLFDTSAIASGYTITSGTFSLYGTSTPTDTQSNNPTVTVYSSAPASNTALAAGDFDSLGSTAFCDSPIALSSWNTSGFNDFALNSSGLAAITKGGITKYGCKSSHDASGSAPTWGSGGSARISTCMADYTGTSQDPKLVVGYLIPEGIFYPDADPEITTSDGCTGEIYSLGSGDTWSVIHGGAGNWVDDSVAEEVYVRIVCDSSSGDFRLLCRSGFLFDTSSLGSSASISGAIFSVYGTATKTFEDGTWGDSDIAINLYSANPASNTAWANGDFDSFGTTAYCDSAISYSSFSTSGYNNFSLNATGRSAIETTGVTKIGIRDSIFDAPNSEPTWAYPGGLAIGGYWADQTGIANDPKLVLYNDGSGFVTHSPAVRYGDDTNTPGTNISSSVKFTMPGSGEYEISEIGLWAYADAGQTMTCRLSIWTYDAVNDCPESMVSNSESSELSTDSPSYTKVSHTYSTRPVLTGGTDYLLAYFMGTDYGNVDNLLPGYSDAGVWTSAATYPTWPTGAQWESANESTEDSGIYAVFIKDYSYDGTIVGTGIIGSDRTVEKVKQGAISGAGYAGATRTIEKVIPGAFQGVGYAISDMAYIPAPYTTVQEGYRFRDNDGNEAAATFLGTQDVAYQGPSGSIRRLRFVINSTGDPASQQFQVEWRWAGGSTWRKLIQ